MRKELRGWGRILNSQIGRRGVVGSPRKFCILTLSFSLKSLKISQVQARKVSFVRTYQLTAHDIFLSYMFLQVIITVINVKRFYFTEHVLMMTDFLLLMYFVQKLHFVALKLFDYHSHASK